MNRRDYKKAVKALGASLCVEFFTIGNAADDMEFEKVQECMNNVFAAMNKATHGANTAFPKRLKDFSTKGEYLKARRRFFHDLYENLSAEYSAVIDKALKDFNAALPKHTA